MKRFSLSLLAGLALAGAAHAQTATDTDTGEVSVLGSVARLCVLGPPSSAQVDLGQMVNTSGLRVGRLTAIGAQSVTLPNSFCNFAGSVLTVDATALVSDDGLAVQPGFARAVNYTATATNWADTPSVATTAATAAGASATATGAGSTQPLPRLADVNVQLTGFTAPGDLLLVSGGYTGLVVVTLGPAAVGGGS